MKKFILFAFVAILQGCATSYQPEGYSGGYSELQLDENVFRVSFKGNGSTESGMASDYALLRSAELTLEKGYKYFAIVEAKDLTKHSTYTAPKQTQTTGYDSGYGVRTYTTTTGGQTYETAQPSLTNTIVCYKEKPDSVFTYNAEIVAKNIRQKYGLK